LSVVYKRKGDRSSCWYYTITVNGDRLRKSTGTTDRAEAIAIAERERSQIRAVGRLGQKPEMTVDDAGGRYLLQVAAGQPSLKNTARQMERLLERLGKKRLLSAIGDAEVADYIAWRRAQKARGKATRVSPATVNREVELLRRILNRAATTWKVATDGIDWKRHRLAEADERNVSLSADQKARFLAELRPDYHPLVQAAMACGLRLNNLITLRWDQVDWEAGRVTVMIQKGGEKGGRKEYKPIKGRFAAILQAVQGQHAVHVFTYQVVKRFYDRFGIRWLPAGSRQPFTMNGWRDEWERARAAAGLPWLRFHDLRHVFGNEFYGATRNIKATQLAMNHKDIRHTLRYLRADVQDVADGMERMVDGPVAVPQASHKVKGG
jgi:integrase